MDIPFTIIPLVAIIGGITYAILTRYFASRAEIAASTGSPGLQAALAASNDLNAQLLERLTSMDARLGSIERTLTEVG
ncbi:hypothetical protein E3O44_12340 [Cryobacterium algoricola]|uniref:Uncharacterized protein n=1 Tax=Cryobacterium algoricola TaxID=1259183 RepID=A0ABY2IBI6_9MICO|nr:hypothetical protein [Cryobacterium algoricola]TFB86239.1 hypothetical protein E3O44_12340 [Cryobacterium algoricola]